MQRRHQPTKSPHPYLGKLKQHQKKTCHPCSQWNTALRRKHPVLDSHMRTSPLDYYQQTRGFKSFAQVRHWLAGCWLMLLLLAWANPDPVPSPVPYPNLTSSINTSAAACLGLG